MQVAEFRQIMAEGFRVQGTRLHVVELLMFGFAYNSRFILLRSKGFMKKLGDEKVQIDLSNHAYKYGKKLELGKELDYDDATRCVYYLASQLRATCLRGRCKRSGGCQG
jgi:hypothetical protein